MPRKIVEFACVLLIVLITISCIIKWATSFTTTLTKQLETRQDYYTELLKQLD